MRELTIEEYEQVSGGFGPLIGGLLGGGGYMLSVIMGANRFSAAQLAGLTVTGAVTGGFSAIGGGLVYGSVAGSVAGAAATNAASIYIELIEEQKEQ